MCDNICWYISDEVAKFNEKHTQKFSAIMKGRIAARKNENESELKKANKDLLKHRALGEEYEKKAVEAGNNWN